jgi:hypothetical protein
MKLPKTDLAKASMPGELAVKFVNGIPTVFPKSRVSAEKDLLEVVWNSGPVVREFDTFDNVRARVEYQWQNLPPVSGRKHLSTELGHKMIDTAAKIRNTPV